MLPTTIRATKAMLDTDQSLTPADRIRLLSLLRTSGKTPPNKTISVPEPRLLRRKEAARRLGCSLRTLDSWAQAGILRRVRLPGRTRSVGIPETEINKLIEGGGY